MADGTIIALAISGTTVYVGGVFDYVGGQPRNSIAALDIASGAATAWNPNSNGLVNTLAISSTNVYAGGEFTTIGGQPKNFVAALDLTTGDAASFAMDLNNPVNALAVHGAKVYVGGTFSNVSAGGVARNHLAALDATGKPTSWNPSPDGDVNALSFTTASSKVVYAGGSFTHLGTTARNHIAAINTGGKLTTWRRGPHGIHFYQEAPRRFHRGGRGHGVEPQRGRRRVLAIHQADDDTRGRGVQERQRRYARLRG